MMSKWQKQLNNWRKMIIIFQFNFTIFRSSSFFFSSPFTETLCFQLNTDTKFVIFDLKFVCRNCLLHTFSNETFSVIHNDEIEKPTNLDDFSNDTDIKCRIIRWLMLLLTLSVFDVLYDVLMVVVIRFDPYNTYVCTCTEFLSFFLCLYSARVAY